MNILTVASDGSCLKNPGGEIGWSWADNQGRWMSNGATAGTNQTAELLGFISILLAFPNTNLLVQLDSQYTLNIADKWMHGWAKAGWTRKGSEIKNLDMVKAIYALSAQRKDKGLTTDFQWVKGHGKAGHFPLNLLVDEKAGISARLVRDGGSPYMDSVGNTTSPRQRSMLSKLQLLNRYDVPESI